MTGLLEHFHFLRPAWLWLLLALPLIHWSWRRQALQANPWRRAVDPHLLPALLEGEPVGVRRRSPLALLLLGSALAALALAGPAWRLEPQPLLRSEAGLIIALDLSERMRAADLPPSRLARARFKVADLLRSRGDGQVALIAYAGDAFTVAPLTNDAATLEALLSALEPEVMPVAGQRAERAIALAMRMRRDAGLARADLLLLTDAADDAAIAAAARAREDGLRVSVLGVGSVQGAPVPLPDGGFIVDADGRPLLAGLQLERLAALAAAGGGRYVTVASDASDLRRLGLLDVATGAALVEDGPQTHARYRDEGPWLLLLLLPLAALGFRRGWLGCLPLLFLLPPQPAQALDWKALWLRPEQRAERALQQGDYPLARALAEDPQRRGSAAYREGDFAAAIDLFAVGDDASAHYNRGNALARAGQLQEAIEAYDEALVRQPGMDDALANRAAVERLLQQMPPQPQPGEGEQGEPGDGERDDDAEPSEPPEPQEGDDPASPAPEDGSEDDPAPEQSEPEEPADPEQQQALTDEIDQSIEEGEAEPTPAEPFDAEAEPELEAEQAIEQMLRRIPDDPGGLLRRKFMLEHRRRQLEGQGDD
jgi:Ca-activated chloride channel homolog